MSWGRMVRNGLRCSFWVAMGVVRGFVGRTIDGSVKLGWTSGLMGTGAMLAVAEFEIRDLEGCIIRSEDCSETSI